MINSPSRLHQKVEVAVRSWNEPHRTSITTPERPAVIMAGLAAPFAAVFSGHPAVAQVVGGASIISIAVLAGLLLVRRVVGERDPGTVLLLDFLLALVVVIGLAGVGVVAAAIP